MFFFFPPSSFLQQGTLGPDGDLDHRFGAILGDLVRRSGQSMAFTEATWVTFSYLCQPCFKSLCTTLLTFIFPLAMDSGILPPGLLCTEGAWWGFRNSDKDQYEDEVKIYIFQRIPQAAETIRCLTLQTPMDLKAPLTVRHLILRLPIRGENEGCIPKRKDACYLYVCYGIPLLWECRQA